MNAPLRQFASPYARKLAREHGIVLAELSGSGPAGRVVAADVLAFVKPAVEAGPPTARALPEPGQAPASRPVALTTALATGIDLGKLQDLLGQFAGAHLPLSADILLMRAAARGLAAIGMGGAIGWETGKGEVVIADAGGLSAGALRARLDTEAASSGEAETAVLSIRRLPDSRVRAVSMPLRPGHRLRLVLSGDGGTAECLLAFDTGSIDEDMAVEFLASFKDDLETPLRLLA